jgi:hypothetical protein
VAAAALPASPSEGELKGVDVFVNWPSRKTDELAAAIGNWPATG